MKIIRKDSENSLIKSFVKEFAKISTKRFKQNKRLSFALTGGTSPINLYKKLSQVDLNWNNIDFFWGDERFVHQKSKDSNYNIGFKYLIKKIKIKKSQIYHIDTKKKSLNLSALDYEKKIKKYFKKKKISFDVMLLGLGQDGHIASIFPKDLKLKSKRITATVIRKDFQRITLNINTINLAKNIFLWLPSKKIKKIFIKKKNQKNKKIPVAFLKKNKSTIFLRRR